MYYSIRQSKIYKFMLKEFLFILMIKCWTIFFRPFQSIFLNNLDTGSVKPCYWLQIIIIKQLSSFICHWHSLEFDIELQIVSFFFCILPSLTVLFRRREEISGKPHGYSGNCFSVAKQWRLTDKIAFLDFWHIFCIKNNHHLIRAGTLCLHFVAPLLRNRQISKRTSLLTH